MVWPDAIVVELRYYTAKRNGVVVEKRENVVVVEKRRENEICWIVEKREERTKFVVFENAKKN